MTSPLLRPLTGNVPWPLVIAIAQTKCLLGREEDYVAGQKPYDGGETFETSGCTSRPRFEKYNELCKENKKFQVSAASYGWLLASVKMSWYIKYCGWKKLTAPVLLWIQAWYLTVVRDSYLNEIFYAIHVSEDNQIMEMVFCYQHLY